MLETNTVAGFSSAPRRMEEEMAAVSWEDPDADWDGLERVLSELALADMASKVQLLQSLSSFLSGVATTMSFSEEFHALSAWVGESAVFLGHKEVSQLHELLVRELKDQTYFLSEIFWTGNKQVDESADGHFIRVLNLEIVSQTLRSCIRILPLVDYFDKSASLSSTRLLDGILEQLCQPTKLVHFLGLKPSEDMHCRRSSRMAQGDEDETCLEHTQPQEPCKENFLDVDSQHRKELIFAILEVYMDELLLRPDLISRLVSSREEVMCLSLAQEQMTSYVTHTEAALEAAFVHVLSSLHPVAFPQTSPASRREGFLVCNLSLPAGLILLEKFSIEDVQPFFIAHIARLLARVLNATTRPGFGLVQGLRKPRQNVVKHCWAGGVDWSYCSQELLPKWDLKDKHVFTNVLPSQPTLNFASSILEHAIRLYMRFSLASDICADGTGSIRYQTVEGSLLQFYLSKFSHFFEALGISGSGDLGIGHLNLCRHDCQSYFSEVMNTQGDLLESGSGTIGFAGVFMHQGLGAGPSYIKGRSNVVFEKEDVKDKFDLVAALLQLMSSALNCIGREVCMLTRFLGAVGDQFLDAQATPLSEFNAADFDKILQCVGLYLSLCLPSAKTLFPIFDERRAGQDECHSNPCGQEPLNVLVGEAILFFTDILRCEVHRGAPDEVLERYFHFVESLVALLLALDEKNDSRKSAPTYDPVCNCTTSADIWRTSLAMFGHGKCRRCSPCEDDGQLPKADNTSSYLEEMVLSLKGMLKDLSLQQRSMPEFLLFFIFKQLSTRDALSLVVMGFSTSLHYDLDVQQTSFHRTEVFQSEGLVTEVLHLALSEPARSRSLFTFIVHIIDILQDLLPITATLSVSEITESISWFETIAYSLTLASQLAVCEQRMFVRNGQEHFLSFMSNMGRGIDRIFTEGIAVVRWLSDLSKTMSEEAWQKVARAWDAMGNCTYTGKAVSGEASNVTASFRRCSIFLGQVDTLRKAVEELVRSMGPSLDGELTPVLEKGRIFIAALSDLLEGKHLAGSQSSLYASESKQHHLGSGPHCYLKINSTEPVLECDHVDGQQKERQSNSSQAPLIDTVVDEIQDHARTPVSDIVQTGDQNLQIDKDPCSAGPHFPIGKVLLPRQEEDIRRQLDDAPIVPEIPVSSVVATVEKRQTRSATSLNVQKLDTDVDRVGSEKLHPIPEERVQCSPTTSAIIKRLLQKRSPPRKSTGSYQLNNKRPAGVNELTSEVEKISGQKRGSCDLLDDLIADGDLATSSNTNLYVDSLSELDPSKDNFDDLKNFIVPKKGRNYSLWLKRRQKVRRRLYSKNFFKRLHEKKELLLLLDT